MSLKVQTAASLMLRGPNESPMLDQVYLLEERISLHSSDVGKNKMVVYCRGEQGLIATKCTQRELRERPETSE